MANAGGIEHPHRAIALRSPLLRVERVISRTTQRSIWEQSEIGSGKSFGEGSACPLRRPTADRLIRFRRLTRLHRLMKLRIGEFRHTHAGSRHLQPELQSKIPDPLSDDLPELLPAGRMRNPAVRVLFLIFIGKHRFKGPAMQVEIKHISGREGVWRDGGEELFIDRPVPQCADRRGRARNLTYSQEHADHRSCGRERNIRAVVECPTGP